MDEPPPLPSTPVLQGAGFGIRLGARILDTIYGLCLGFAGGVIGGITLVILQRARLIDPGWQKYLGGKDVLSYVLSFVGVMVYHTMSEGIYGASLGKAICQLRVISENGGPSTFKGAFIRNISYFVDALFFGLIGYNSMRKTDLNQRYGDHWGHTIVVARKDLPLTAARPVSLAFGAIIAGSVCWILLLSLGLILHVLRQG
jgi:uncharacterized RDD family membrane protein YckC